jgi:hypothetical protein
MGEVNRRPKDSEQLADEIDQMAHESIYNRSKGQSNRQKRQIDGTPGGVDEFGTNLLITRLLDRWARSIEGQKTAKRLADETNRTVYKSIYNRSSINQKARATDKRDRSTAPRGMDELDTHQLITQSMDEDD